MNFENKLISGLFIKRYKRFFVDVKVNNKINMIKIPLFGMRGKASNKNPPMTEIKLPKIIPGFVTCRYCLIIHAALSEPSCSG